MDTVDLGTPIATLRSLGALAKDGVPSGSHVQDSSIRASLPSTEHYAPFDPVARGLLSIYDAQRAINM